MRRKREYRYEIVDPRQMRIPGWHDGIIQMKCE
jgi:hypothetical protein